ncbi:MULTISPECIES: MFS transporter [Actinomadura]|uniref:MFS transporter n=1 Tax=Actinomadura yumaensis TaxID=111807 RepID=A0ABW2CN83_9ACTN|nr:MFS transporter [Actinomadura sp. J1-007]
MLRINRSEPIPMLSVGHACVDVYQGAVPAVVPFLVSERHYGYGAASGIVLAATLLSSVVQPVFGVLTDRRAMPWLVPVSMVAAGLGISASGLTGSYPLIWALVALTGLGVAGYHPESARLARRASGGGHVRMSWFALGGNVGFALAPLLVTPVLSAGGLAASPLLFAPAAVGVLLTLVAMRTVNAEDGPAAGPARRGEDDWRSFGLLTAGLACRSVVYVGLGAFVALHVRHTVHAPGAGAAALFTLYAGASAGTLIGGRLASRYGRVRITGAAALAAIPAVAGAVLVPGYAVYPFVAATSMALYVPFSLSLTLGQDYLPGRLGTASGVTLGLAVTVGGLATPVIGFLADATSLRAALVPLIAFPALTWLFTHRLPEPGRREEPRAATPERARG